VKNTESQTIFNEIKNTLLSFGLYHKVRSISTDGAKALISKKNGVVGKLAKDIPGLINIHCIAHRLNLGVSDGWKADTRLKTLNTMIYNLCRLFKKAPSKFRILQDYELEYLGYTEKLVSPLDIRWMSKYKAVCRILKLYPFIMLALTKLSKNKDEAATSLLLQLKDFKNIAYLKILEDLTDIINPLNNIFQSKNVSINRLHVSFTIAKTLLSDLAYKDEIYGDSFGNFIETISQKEFKFFGVKLIHKNDDLSFVKKRSHDLAKMMLFNLKSRFSDLEVLKEFEVLSYANLNQLNSINSNFFNYGNKEIENL